jgi:hypothetical protein
MFSLVEHKWLLYTIAALFSFCLLLASELLPAVSSTLELVPMPTPEIGNTLLVYMVADTVAVAVVDRAIRFLFRS